jgi:hypothetical protein
MLRTSIKTYTKSNKRIKIKIEFVYIAAIVGFKNWYCSGLVTCLMKGSEPHISL